MTVVMMIFPVTINLWFQCKVTYYICKDEDIKKKDGYRHVWVVIIAASTPII